MNSDFFPFLALTSVTYPDGTTRHSGNDRSGYSAEALGARHTQQRTHARISSWPPRVVGHAGCAR